jgi:hypothetical protein
MRKQMVWKKKINKDVAKWKNDTYEGEKQDGDGKQQTMKSKTLNPKGKRKSLNLYGWN